MTDNIKAFLEADALRTQGDIEHIQLTDGYEVLANDEVLFHVFSYDMQPPRTEDAKFFVAASRIAPDLAKMVDDLRVAESELEAMLTAVTFAPKTELPNGAGLGWYAMVPEGFVIGAEQALTRLKPYEKLFEKEGERDECR